MEEEFKELKEVIQPAVVTNKRGRKPGQILCSKCHKIKCICEKVSL